MVLLLKKLILKNFKTYERGEFNFTKGHNVVIGENGAGKSSIFEAISYCLFGSVPGKTSYSLIQHGKRKMELSLDFSINDENLRVECSATQSTSNFILMKDGEIIAEKITIVREIIQQKMGLGKRVFNNAIYIQQGQIAAIASERPSERRDLFDRILGYHLYRKTNTRLRTIEKLTREKNESTKKRLQDYEYDVKKKSEIEKQLKEFKEKKVELEKELKALLPELKAKEEKYNNMNEKREKINQIEERIKTQKIEIEKREKEIDEIKYELQTRFEEEITSTKPEKIIEIQDKLKKQLLELERNLKEIEKKENRGREIENNIKSLDKQTRNIENQITKLSKKIEQEEIELENIDQIIAEIDKKKEKKEQTKHRETEQLQELIEKDKQHSILTENIKQKKVELKKLQKKAKNIMKKLEDNFPDWKTILERELERDITEDKKDYSKKLVRERNELTRIERRISSLETLIEEEEKIIKLVKDKKEEGKCPRCESPLTETHAKKIVKESKEVIKKNDVKKETLAKKRENIKNNINELEKRIVILYEEEKKTIYLKNLVAEKKNTKTQLKKVKEEIVNNQEELKNVGDTEKQLNEKRVKIKKLDENISDLNDELKKIESVKIYGAQLYSLNDQLDKLKEERISSTKEPEYKKLAENTKKLTKKKEDQRMYIAIIPKVESLIKNMQSLEENRKKREEETDELKCLKQAYDEKLFSEYQAQVDKIKAKKVKYETQLNSYSKDLIPDKQKQYEDVLEKEKKLIEIQKELQVDEKKLSSITLVRDFLIQTIPILRRQHVRAISEYSTEIFLHLINSDEYNGIEITENYDLKIIQSGRKHDLIILSGGEQVITCLAIRLAIAKLLANHDILLLDEPTVMLDTQRRRELVEVFDKTKPVQQTIIVTHDYEFERIADTTFTIIKKAGKANVLAEEIDSIVIKQKEYRMLTQERFEKLEI